LPRNPIVPTRATVLLLALVAALVLFRLGALPLVGPDEPRYARVAVEMHRAGQWVRPTLQGQPWLEKPALYYWLAGAAYGLLGETEVAARLPSLLAAVCLVACVIAVGRRLHDQASALHAGYILGTSLLFFAYARAASMDMLLAAAVTGAIGFAGLRLLGLAGAGGMVAAWGCAGLAVLAKGPLGLLLPMLVVGGHVVLTRRWAALRDVLTPLGVFVFVAVAAPWYVLVWRDQGQHFVDVFLLDHNLQRFTSTIHRHPGPPWYYLPLLLAGFFPWSGLLLPAIARLWRERTPADVFVMAWLALPLVFFSLAGSKLPGYILPCLPPLALLAGRAAAALAAGDDASPRGTGPRAVAVATLALSAVIAALPVVLLAQRAPEWRLTVPLAAWVLIVAWLFSRRIGHDPSGALRLMRVGAAGFLLLLALAAPPIVAARESGASLFAPAGGREVLAWRAWRTAWMAGYFYNDGRVREVETLAEVVAAARAGPVLVVCAPREREELGRVPGLRTSALATGPRGHVLLEVAAR
jgi:4-amino-4-deoxy-L-arabinose transferase-like glycosyltransferase